jgi:hypothetical protein
MGIEQPVQNFQDMNLIVGANNKHDVPIRLDIKCENPLHAAVEVEMNTRKPPGSLTSMKCGPRQPLRSLSSGGPPWRPSPLPAYPCPDACASPPWRAARKLVVVIFILRRLHLNGTNAVVVDHGMPRLLAARRPSCQTEKGCLPLTLHFREDFRSGRERGHPPWFFPVLSEGTKPRCRIAAAAADPTMELFHWRYALGLCVEEFDTGGTFCVSSDVRA